MFSQSLNFLRSIGIQEWVLSGDENFVSFSEWFSSSITDSNIATDTVILEYVSTICMKIDLFCLLTKLCWCFEGIVICNRAALNWLEMLCGTHTPKLKANIKTFGVSRSSMFSECNIGDTMHGQLMRIMWMQCTIWSNSIQHFLGEWLTNYTKIYVHRICQTAIVDDLAATTKLLDEFVDAVAKCTERCVRKVHDLQETKQRNRKSINELVHRYIKPVNIHSWQSNWYFYTCNTDIFSCLFLKQKFPLFVHQMSLEQYFKKCDTFLNSADTYFDKNFAVEVMHLKITVASILVVTFLICNNCSWIRTPKRTVAQRLKTMQVSLKNWRRSKLGMYPGIASWHAYDLTYGMICTYFIQSLCC